MGQAFRRASGRFRVTDPSPTSKTVSDTRYPVAAKDKVDISRTAAQINNQDSIGSDGDPTVSSENLLEERDQKYDMMLNQMAGRIRTKPGGKLEIGEAAVVEKYNRPMPKLRNTKPDSDRYEERPTTPGTLNIAQLRHIMLLHQGKAEDQNGPMEIRQIAEMFRLEVGQVQQILQFVSLPPEDSNKKKSYQ
ncbi:uncharacterized protein [Euphorbia lathyris]|uniref:uncharacterized protein n=1 Tax=Euphorbia lathyris TaxID=212925 RepID=UPI003313DB38